MTTESPLEPILKQCDPIIQDYVIGLRSEISKLAKYIAHLEAENITLNSRIKSLGAKLKEHPYSEPDINDLSKRAEESLKSLTKQ